MSPLMQCDSDNGRNPTPGQDDQQLQQNRASNKIPATSTENSLQNCNQNARHYVPSPIHSQITDLHLRKSIDTPTRKRR